MLYAVQVSPEEFYVSGVDFESECEVVCTKPIIVLGGRKFVGVNEDIIKDIKTICEDFELIGDKFGDCVKANVRKVNNKDFTKEELKNIENVYNNESESSFITYVLGVLYGATYVETCFRGCLQGDYVKVIMSDKDLSVRSYLESLYFNTGSLIRVYYSVNHTISSVEELEDNFDSDYEFYTDLYEPEDIVKYIKSTYDDSDKIKLFMCDKIITIRKQTYKTYED